MYFRKQRRNKKLLRALDDKDLEVKVIFELNKVKESSVKVTSQMTDLPNRELKCDCEEMCLLKTKGQFTCGCRKGWFSDGSGNKICI